jgi:hypothetical protein
MAKMMYYAPPALLVQFLAFACPNAWQLAKMRSENGHACRCFTGMEVYRKGLEVSLLHTLQEDRVIIRAR